MDLYTYFTEKKKVDRSYRLKDLAAEIGCSPSYLSAIINNNTHCGLKFAKKVQKITEGKVTVLEILRHQYENDENKENVKKD